MYNFDDWINEFAGKSENLFNQNIILLLINLKYCYYAGIFFNVYSIFNQESPLIHFNLKYS